MADLLSLKKAARFFLSSADTLGSDGRGASLFRKWAKACLDTVYMLEPRLMELDEIRNAVEPVWLEFIGRTGDWILIRDGKEEDTIRYSDREAYPYILAVKEYNAQWRCWNRKPSEKQTKETPWYLI